MNKLFVLLVLVLVAGALCSQEVVVRDSFDKTALPQAEISNNSSLKVITNKNGVFKLDTFKNDLHIFISYAGYKTKKVNVNSVSKKDPTILLEPQTLDLNPAVIKPKGEFSNSDPVQQIEVINARQIQFGNPMNSASILENSGLVSVQRSQLGGGSPQMRGFEANKVLLIIDGVRMNNAIYRSGHVQNAITVDANILQQTEVYFGPSSVLFGSDALGGAIHFKTKKPILAEKFNQNITRVNVMGRAASASQERTFHADVMYGAKKWGLLTSITQSDFGDLRMGNRRTHGSEDWGLVPFYAAREEGADVMKENGNPTIQKYTGYHQLDFLQKVTFKASEKTLLNFNFQYSNSSDVPRFDRLNDLTNGELKWAEWHYGPQKRILTSANLQLFDRKHFTEGNITIANQMIHEDRIKRRFGNNAKFYNLEQVNVTSLNADFVLVKSKRVKWLYGAEVIYTRVESEAYEKDIITGIQSEAITRYPGGGSNYSTLAIYGNRTQVLNEKTDFHLGIRYNHTLATSLLEENPFYDLTYNEIKINDGALTGSAGIIYSPSEKWKLKGNLASGFKSPNVDDFGKIFEKDGYVDVPNGDLQSEYLYSADITIERYLQDKKIRVSATPYYTYLTNAIVSRDTTLNGNNLFLFEGELAQVQSNRNAAQAHIFGISAKLKTKLTKNLLASATYNFTYGQDLSDDVPMSSIPPQFGKINLEYQKGRFTGEFYVLYSAKKSLDRYAPGTTDNLAETLPNGNPAWQTFNIRTSTRISKTVLLQLAVENILDLHYKAFASGLSSPGRNVILSLKTFF